MLLMKGMTIFDYILHLPAVLCMKQVIIPVFVFPQILYRQWGNDSTSWLGDVPIGMCHSPGGNHMHTEVHCDTKIRV